MASDSKASDSYGLDDAKEAEDSMTNNGKNFITFDFDDLEPVNERIKLEGDEYERSRLRVNREEATNTASMEIYRSLDSLPQEHRMAIKEALEDSLLSGSLLGYPMVSTRIRILDGRHSNLRSKSPLIFQQGAVSIVKDLYRESSPCLLEPFMTVEINVPEGIL